MAIQNLRSSSAHKRPIPDVLSAGQIAVNTNQASPGLFFKDSNGDLVKVGPVHIGTSAPNSSPATTAADALVSGTVAADFEDDRDLVKAKAGPENFTPSADVPGRFCTALQFAGDVVIVPPKAWHQTYALEPSCAVASQFCGRRDAPTVFEHMLRHRARDDDGVLDLARTAPPRDAVRALFARLGSDS